MNSPDKISLGDKYDLSKDRVFLSGTQAVIRMVLMQHELDHRAGLNTAGYISGYRGSPLGALDLQLARLTNLLEANSIKFQPGLNEDLAATALWGTQQAELRGEGLYDGVFGLWYGKGPGVDRSGDVFRHANHAGTSKYGGVVALMGDDHTCESSTSAHQSEFAFVDAMMPVLNPASVQEILDYGLFGWALSRYAGVWIGLKCVKDNIEQTGSVDGRLDRIEIKIPHDFEMPEGGLNIRLGDTPLAKEARLHDYKRYAILSFARANNLDRMILRGGRKAKIGVIAAGKSFMDVAEALELLDIDEVRAADIGLRLYKPGLTWPLEPEGINKFAEGLDLIIVVEEKRSLIETQIREQLYRRAGAPQIIGKRDEVDRPLFPAKGALDAVMVALELARRLVEKTPHPFLSAKLEELEKITGRIRNSDVSTIRTPYFCAGCPHNSSTIVPDGSRAYAGIGCHYMVQWMDRSTEGFTQMGGEGANWIGEEAFSKRNHVFQNLGDGTYMHSGSLAIRAAVVANANITFKLLYNDAVAMTGGQPIDGGVSVMQMVNQISAEGVQKIVVISDEPEKYSKNSLTFGTTVHHRDSIQEVQKELRKVKGVSVLLYDQTCAAEKRRRRKRGLYPDPQKRVVINESVCEGCGDCGVQSNCIAIQPVETEFG
ncbi:MAG: indolepyruvate ferredoxin oxidoreductase family protein, partial [Desulfobulbia bacterium]